MHSFIHVPFAGLLLTLPGGQKEPRTPCPCCATVVVVSDTALAHHPGFEGIADTSATYRLGFLNATGTAKERCSAFWGRWTWQPEDP